MEGLSFSLVTTDIRRVVVALILSFALAQAISGVYVLTFRGLSYSRSVVQGMAIGGVIPCMLMLSIGSNLAAGFGIAGGLALIRFRTALRDPRDILFLFAALAAGVACGLQSYGTAIAGTIVFSVASLTLHYLGYGARREFDGLLRFNVDAARRFSEADLAKILASSCRSYVLVTLRETAQGSIMEHAYQISLRDEELRDDLVRGLKSLPGIADITLLMQEPTLDL
jgi:hypothetical protein